LTSTKSSTRTLASTTRPTYHTYAAGFHACLADLIYMVYSATSCAITWTSTAPATMDGELVGRNRPHGNCRYLCSAIMLKVCMLDGGGRNIVLRPCQRASTIVSTLFACSVVAVNSCPHVLSSGSAGTMSKPLISRCVRPDTRFNTCISATPVMAHTSAPKI
jgi:hypothetical protein